MNIKLTKAEYTYLIISSFLSLNLKILIQNVEQEKGDAYFLTITEDQADELRDLCGEQLQLAGFDEHYRPTKEGEIFEELIDKLFC